jgi:hypothetical protein
MGLYQGFGDGGGYEVRGFMLRFHWEFPEILRGGPGQR